MITQSDILTIAEHYIQALLWSKMYQTSYFPDSETLEVDLT